MQEIQDLNEKFRLESVLQRADVRREERRQGAHEHQSNEADAFVKHFPGGTLKKAGPQCV
jgi:hypothetical protein